MLLLATNNPHKVDELREILRPLGVDVRTLADLPRVASLPEPAEDAETFVGNAELKAAYYARHAGLMCLADDSGLEVDALGGAPGVRSARFAAAEGDDAGWSSLPRDERDRRNNALLLDRLRGVPDERRAARFVCAMALIEPKDAGVRTLATARGTFEGRIAHAPRGDRGFGYDPLLILTDANDPLAGKHAAELSPSEKNARSHRGQAARSIAEQLARLV